jgi:hypothetical protein
MLSVVKFRNVASRKDKIAYVTFNESLTNFSKFMLVGVLTMRSKHDYIVKGSIFLCTKTVKLPLCLKHHIAIYSFKNS